MKRIAIFVEGESEKIFVYNLLLKIIDASKLKIECFKVGVDNNFKPDSYSYSSPTAEIDILIFDSGGDNRVVSSIYRSAKNMNELGYETIIGLRDLYCQQYDDLSPSKINPTISNKIMEAARETLGSLKFGENVKLFFSVMELEAWYLGFIDALDRMGYSLTDINRILGIKLEEIDPEGGFYKPKSAIEKVHTQVKGNAFNEVKFAHSISQTLRSNEISAVVNSGKLSHFKDFVECISSF